MPSYTPPLVPPQYEPFDRDDATATATATADTAGPTPPTTTTTVKQTYVTIREAKQITGLHPQTLRKYADDGRIKSYKTAAGQRRLHLGDLQQVVAGGETASTGLSGAGNPTRNPAAAAARKVRRRVLPRVNYIYARISPTTAANPETDVGVGALQQQVDAVIQQNRAYADYVVVSDVATGTQFRHKGVFTLLDACVRGTVGEVVVAHRDRLGRVAHDLLQHLIQKAGGKIVALDLEPYRSSQAELAEDLFAFMQKHVYHGSSSNGGSTTGKKTALVRAPATEETVEGTEAAIPAPLKRPRGRPPRAVATATA